VVTVKMPQTAAGEVFQVVSGFTPRVGVAGFLAAAVCSFAAAAVSPTADQGWVTLTEENNNLGSDSDRYYVNGANLAYLSGPLAGDRGWADRIERGLPLLFAADGKRDVRYEWTVLGQQIFTPADKTLSVPDPNDRPYAGWLYTGINLLRTSTVAASMICKPPLGWSVPMPWDGKCRTVCTSSLALAAPTAGATSSVTNRR